MNICVYTPSHFRARTPSVASHATARTQARTEGRKDSLTDGRTHAHTHTRTHAHTHARTHTRTHLDKGERSFKGFRQVTIADDDVCEVGHIVKDGPVEMQTLDIKSGLVSRSALPIFSPLTHARRLSHYGHSDTRL